jgi:hypothetical protein
MGGKGLAMSMWRARVAAKLFPFHSDLLDKINGNALVRRWIAEHSVAGWPDTHFQTPVARHSA